VRTFALRSRPRRTRLSRSRLVVRRNRSAGNLRHYQEGRSLDFAYMLPAVKNPWRRSLTKAHSAAPGSRPTQIRTLPPEEEASRSL